MMQPDELVAERSRECVHECTETASICLPCAKGAAYDAAVRSALRAIEVAFDEVRLHRNVCTNRGWKLLMEYLLDDIRSLYWRVKGDGLKALEERAEIQRAEFMEPKKGDSGGKG